MSVNGYLFAAYVVIFSILFVYLVYLNRKQKEVGRQLESIVRSLEKK